MIITEIKGGLGNQMFQYAAGRVLAEINKTNLLLDTKIYDNQIMHNGFELSRIFNIDSGIAKHKDISKLNRFYNYKIEKYIRAYVSKFLNNYNYYNEKNVTFDSEFFKLKDKCYLSGYWQSEKYFANHVDLIRNQFKFKIFLSSQNSIIADTIKKTSNTISLHIRRGDYLSTVEARSVHYVCNLDYYKRAMREIETKIINPTYFIFSDDIEWTKKNIKIKKNHHYIDHNNSIESYNDMRLMSLCDHHIIANSSFSWWGAWLNPKIDKIVIAPKKWFANGLDCTTHVPENWLRI